MDDAPLADNPAGPDGPEESDVEIQGGLKLIGLQRGEEGWSDRVVQHGCQKGSQHVAHGVRERFRGFERQLDGAVLDVRVDELKAERRGGPGHRRTPFDAIPEWPCSIRHFLHSLLATAPRRVFPALSPRRGRLFRVINY